MGEILVLCPLMNKSTLAYSTLYSGNTKGNWEFLERKAAKELCAKLRFAAHPQAFPLGGRCPSAHTGADEGPIIERFFVGPDALIRPLSGPFRRGVSPPARFPFTP